MSDALIVSFDTVCQFKMNPQLQRPGFCFPGCAIGSRATGVKQRFFWNKGEFVFRAVGANLDAIDSTKGEKRQKRVMRSTEIHPGYTGTPERGEFRE